MKEWIIIGLVFVLLFSFGCISDEQDEQGSAPESLNMSELDSKVLEEIEIYGSDFSIYSKENFTDYYFWENHNCAYLYYTFPYYNTTGMRYYYMDKNNTSYHGHGYAGFFSPVYKLNNPSESEALMKSIIRNNSKCGVGAFESINFRKTNGVVISASRHITGPGCQLADVRVYADNNGQILLMLPSEICVD